MIQWVGMEENEKELYKNLGRIEAILKQIEYLDSPPGPFHDRLQREKESLEKLRNDIIKVLGG